MAEVVKLQKDALKHHKSNVHIMSVHCCLENYQDAGELDKIF